MYSIFRKRRRTNPLPSQPKKKNECMLPPPLLVYIMNLNVEQAQSDVYP